MQYRSIGDLSLSVATGAWKVPADVDLIVGIPRSGLLAGSMLALHLNIPIVELDCYLNGGAGRIGRTSNHTVSAKSNDVRKVLVVDDTVATGKTMAQIRREIDAVGLGDNVLVCAIYGTQKSHDGFDLIFETVSTPRMFEWNMMRHKRIADACFDIDGVLCHDPDPADNDDGLRYERFVSTARPLYIPKLKVAHVVTSRLERYRPETEAWLKTTGIEYGKLWMIDLPSAEERRRLKAHAPFKARVYQESGANLFIESEDKQAEDIARLSGRPVLSIGGQRMVWPDDPAANRRHVRRAGWSTPKRSTKSRVKRVALQLCRHLHLPIDGLSHPAARPTSTPAGIGGQSLNK